MFKTGPILIFLALLAVGSDDSRKDILNSGEPNISAEEAEEMNRDMKLPPYHLSLVDETEDDEIPTGEYEICQRCGGEGCIECEEGLKDITGVHKVPDFSDYKGE